MLPQSWLIIIKAYHSVKHMRLLENLLVRKLSYYLQDVPLERYQEVSDLIEEDIYETLKSHTAVERRHSLVN